MGDHVYTQRWLRVRFLFGMMYKVNASSGDVLIRIATAPMSRTLVSLLQTALRPVVGKRALLPPAFPIETPVGSRLRAVLLHIPWYSIEGFARLATDVNVSRSTISRLTGGRQQPSFRLAQAIADAVSFRLGTAVSPRELFGEDGAFPTGSTCDLCRCKGCLPPEAYDERSDRLKPAWKGAIPGDWCRYPETKPILKMSQ